MFKLCVLSALLVLQGLGINADCDTPSVTTASGTHAPTGKICPNDLIFEQNFDDLDTKIWHHESTLGGGGNWEFEWYTNNRTTSYAEDGNFVIKPRFVADDHDPSENFIYSGTLDINGGSPADECTNPAWYGCSRTGSANNPVNVIKSARVRTLGSFQFKFGKVEVRAKLPAGDWLWPAIWMLPADNQYSGWPASGEIDIMESRGNRELIDSKGVDIGTKTVGTTLHWGPSWNANKYEMTTYQAHDAAGYNTDFHLYQLEWTPDHIVFKVDNAVTGTITPPEGGFWELGNLAETGMMNPWRHASKMAPFDQEFYILLNLACGGIAYFPDDARNRDGAKPWSNTSPTAMKDFWEGRSQWLPTWNMDTDDQTFKVDYVKVWAI